MDYRQMLNKYGKMYYDYAMAEESKRQEAIKCGKEIERQKKLNIRKKLKRKEFCWSLNRRTKAKLTLS